MTKKRLLIEMDSYELSEWLALYQLREEERPSGD